MNKKSILVIALSLIGVAAILLLAQFGIGEANNSVVPLLTEQDDCVVQGGSWDGSGADIGACTYPANSVYAIQQCGANFIYIETFDPDHVDPTYCNAVVSDSQIISWSEREPGPEIGSKCKLIEIDSILSVGGSFHAKWIGVMTSIRFRQPGAGLEFIAMIPGTLSYELVHADHDHLHRSADFENGFLLQPGRWEATCWGPEGTFGTALIVHVKN